MARGDLGSAVRGLALGVALVTVAPSARAEEADTKQACIGAHAEAQRARLAGRLRGARGSAISCSQASCPSVLRSDCTRLLAEIESAMPSLIVEVPTDRGPTLAVTLDVDGERLANRLDGKAIVLDPGEHTVRVTAEDGRSAERRVVLLEGEPRARIVIELPPPSVAPPAGSSTPPSPAARPWLAPAPKEERASWALPAATAGAGLVALAVFGTFGLRGYREQIVLESTCAPACAPGRDDGMRRDYLVADVALVSSIALLAGATWLALRR